MGFLCLKADLRDLNLLWIVKISLWEILSGNSRALTLRHMCGFHFTKMRGEGPFSI